MATTANKTGSSYEPVPAGTYPARIYSFIHLGTRHEDTAWGPKDVNKIRFTWELPTVRKEFKEGDGEKPYSISQEYTLSMSEKANLRKMTESVLGVSLKDDEAFAYDVEELVGQPCLLQVVHKVGKNGNTYANIANVMAIPNGMSCPEQENKSYILNYSDPDFGTKFDALPQFIKDKMIETYELNNKMKERGMPEIEDDEIPF